MNFPTEQNYPLTLENVNIITLNADDTTGTRQFLKSPTS